MEKKIKKYHIDGEPADFKDIIRKAKEYDEDFAAQEILQSSVAADILRKHGHKVGDISEIEPECDVCDKERAKNLIICSGKCAKIRQMIFDLEDEYFPCHGCDNCWGDLYQGCTQQCKKEFSEAAKFGTKLWKIVHTITGHKEMI